MERIYNFRPLAEGLKNRENLSIDPKMIFRSATLDNGTEKDIEYLKLKQENGAEYIVAQYFYNNQFFYDYVDRCRAAGITVPIIPGIMPIYTVKMTEALAKVCGTMIPDEVSQGLAKIASDDKEAILQFGIDFATRQCRDLLKHGVQGLHFYTMNRAKSVTTILKTLKSEGLL